MKQLNQREKLFLTVGAIVLAILLFVGGLILPYRSAITRVDSSILIHQQQLQDVKKLRMKYIELKTEASRLHKDLQRDKIPALLTFLETTAVSVAGRESLVLMRPLPSVVKNSLRTETVEFKMERILLEQALKILWDMETARPPIRVERLFIKQRFDDASQLDMNVTASAGRRN